MGGYLDGDGRKKPRHCQVSLPSIAISETQKKMAVEILSAEKTGSVKSEESSPPTAPTSTSEISNLGPQLPPAAPLGDDHPAEMQNSPAASSSPTSSSPSASSSSSLLLSPPPPPPCPT